MRVYWAAVYSGCPVTMSPVTLWTATIRDKTPELAEAQAERRARAQGLQDPLTVFVDDIGAANDKDLDHELNPHHYEDRND